MKATVIIPTRDRWATLGRTLPTVLNQDVAASDYEIIVVDDGSTVAPSKSTRRIVCDPRVTLLKQANKGPAAARNRALSVARGDIVLFLDDDILCSPGLLRRHLDAHRGRESLLTYGPIFLAPESPGSLIARSTGAWYAAHWRRVGEQGGLRFPSDGLLASNSAFKRATLGAIGGFDEAAPSREDAELGIRVWKRGTPMTFVPDAIAHEMFVKPTSEYARGDATRCGRADVYICAKHPEYRQHSGLATLGATGVWRRALRRAAMAVPVPMLKPLDAFYWIVERLPRLGWLHRAACTVLALHYRVMYLHGACQEIGGWDALQRAFGLRLPVLLYHRVGPDVRGLPATLTVTPDRFESQLRWLARNGYRTISVSEWTAWCTLGTPLPQRVVLITFDDAYADIAVHALPSLQRHGFSATVFVVTSEVGGSNRWDEPRGFPTLALMSAEEIRRWAAQGVEFGAHARTHLDLTAATTEARHAEIAGSAVDLAGVLGCAISVFAYPYGHHDAAARAIAGASFQAAVTCDEGLNSLATDLARLNRTAVHPTDMLANFACRVALGMDPLRRIRARIAALWRSSAQA